MLIRAGMLTGSRRPQLPVRILLHDLAVPERPQVATPDLEPLAVHGRATKRPLGCAAITRHEMLVLLVADIRDPGETAGEGLTHRRLAVEALAVRLRAPGCLEHGVVCEV